MRVAGVVVGGVGVAGIVVGAVTGSFAVAKKSEGDEGCDRRDFCPPAAFDARNSAFTMATVSTIGFIAGGTLVAGGVVLFVAGGEGDAEATATVAPAGLRLSGSF